MRSTFTGLNIGYSGLAAQQRALDITGHNVANANTQGYTRQEVIMQATPALKVLKGYVGTGVDIAEIRRVKDQFLEIQMRTESKALGEWETKANLLNKLEVIFNEPSETSVRSVMDQFWEAWQVLAKNPESVAARTTVMQRGTALTSTFNHLDSQFSDLQADINKSLAVKANEINSFARQIGELNHQIIKAEANGGKANDLRDRRELLLEQLAKNINIDVTEDQLGAINVTIGGKFLVSRAIVSEVRFFDDYADPTQAKLEWYDPLAGTSQGPVRANGGILKGYQEIRDAVIVEYQEKMSALAATIAEEVNTLHRAGYELNGETGRAFFTADDGSLQFNARNIRVNPEIIDDINRIAAAGDFNPDPAADPAVYQGDGKNALKMAQLKNKLTMTGGAATFGDFYRSAIGQLGIQGQEASQMVENKVSLVEQLINRREAVSGVSLDEEMTNMIRFQHAYTASARILNVMDEMLDIIVNRLGMAGR
ncbi:MAG: flagellar hook-associated protein FlgK [Clostridia bacterium]|nr:flagellar hook-associated protein FlgK [Clostridia bacterium]